MLLGKNGNLVLTGGIRVLKKDQTSSSGTSMDIFTSDNINECKSFYSWFDTKFVRFFVLINISCQSTNIKKVSTASKAGSVFMWGLLSQKVKKQWHCNNCGYEW